MSKNSAWDFVKRHIFFLLGGVCIVIVGVLFIVSRGDGAQVVRENGFGAEQNGSVIDETDADIAVGSHASETADGSNIADNSDNQPATTIDRSQENLPQPTPYIGIHIVGAVYAPGFFMLPADARVNCAVERAGGLTGDADIARVNLAEFLRDGMQIIIPAEGEDVDEVLIFSQVAAHSGAGVQGGGAQGATATTQRGITPSGLVNINFANATELQTLTGVGPTIAQNIIDFRELHGMFSSVDELIHVSRIGAVTLENLRANVTVGLD